VNGTTLFSLNRYIAVIKDKIQQNNISCKQEKSSGMTEDRVDCGLSGLYFHVDMRAWDRCIMVLCITNGKYKENLQVKESG
jgi:hypothetical protein